MITIHTFGHGSLAAEQLVALVSAAAVRRVVDVRSHPGSRRNPQFGRSEIERWLPAAGVSYTWMPSLGGRRRPAKDSKNVALRHDAFRGYADHMASPEFLAGVDELLAVAAAEPSAVMCSEAVWWRCHRRLLADHLALVREVEVVHLMHDGRRTAHAPTTGARLVDGALVYDVGDTRGPLERAEGLPGEDPGSRAG